MVFKVASRVMETTTTTGTGTLTLLGAVSGFQSFSSGIGNANTTYYAIVHQTAAEWEMGIGTYTSSGTTFSRDTVISSSNSNSAVSFSAGTKNVYCDSPASRTSFINNNGYITPSFPSGSVGVIESSYINLVPTGTVKTISPNPTGGSTFTIFGYAAVPSNTLCHFEALYPLARSLVSGGATFTLRSSFDGTASYTVMYNMVQNFATSTTALYSANNGRVTSSNNTAAVDCLTSIVGTTNTAISIYARGTLRISTGGTVRHALVVSGTLAGAAISTAITLRGGWFRVTPLGPISGTADLNIGGWA